MLPREFFKGWYFKCCGPQGTVALIPAVHRDGRGETASLQILTEGAAYSHEAAVYLDPELFKKRFADAGGGRCAHAGGAV